MRPQVRSDANGSDRVSDPFWRTADAEIVYSACSRPRRSCSRHARARRARRRPRRRRRPSRQPSAEAPSATPAPTPIDYDQLLYGYKYEPSTGTPGGKVIISDWQAANQLNPYFSNAFANSQVYRGDDADAAGRHQRRPLQARPVGRRRSRSATNVKEDADGKGGLHRPPQDQAGPEVVGRRAVHPERHQVHLDGGPRQGPGRDHAPSSWDEVDKIDVSADGNEADVHFKEPFAGWLGLVGAQLILPEHYMKTIPIKDWAAKSYPVSSAIAKAPTIGPFKYVTATADTIELARDDNWAGPAEACSGKACLDSVTYKFYPDNKEGMIAAFLTGEIDVALDLVQADYDAIKDVDPAIGDGDPRARLAL